MKRGKSRGKNAVKVLRTRVPSARLSNAIRGLGMQSTLPNYARTWGDAQSNFGRFEIGRLKIAQSDQITGLDLSNHTTLQQQCDNLGS